MGSAEVGVGPFRRRMPLGSGFARPASRRFARVFVSNLHMGSAAIPKDER
jgi:hypothetical protein